MRHSIGAGPNLRPRHDAGLLGLCAYRVKQKTGVFMKMVFAVFASFALLVGCGQSQEPASEAPAAPAEASAPAESSAPANDVIVDYVWNDVGPDVTDEQFADIVARWNARIDAGGYDMMGANVLRPQFETEDFDVIWVLLWPSSEARESAWAHWNANQVEEWTAELDGALSYQAENVFTFKPVGGWDKSLEPVPAGGSFMPNFSFCKMNEGLMRLPLRPSALSTTHGLRKVM